MNRLKDIVENNPTECYRIYKYILQDKADLYRDPRKVPKALQYIIEVSPKLQKQDPIITARGALTDVSYFTYDEVNHEWGEETHKVHNDWGWDNDAVYKSGESFLYKKCYRQWILEDGTYKIPFTIQQIRDGLAPVTIQQVENNETDIKFTYKRYHKLGDPTTADYELSMPVGKRARGNIIYQAEVRIVTLVAILLTAGDEELAQDIGLAFLEKYNGHYGRYYEKGDSSFVDLINQDQDETVITDVLGNVLLAGLTFKSFLDTVIPATVNLGQGPIPIEMIVPGANTTATLRNYIVEKYKGEI